MSESTHQLVDKRFDSKLANLTHEHFMKVVGSTYNYKGSPISFYKYLHYSSPFHSSRTLLPTIRMHFDITPIRVIIDETRKPVYKFMTSVFALVGGTFTFFGLLDSFVDNAHQTMKRKVNLGKSN